ncbi:peptidoglycan-binding protein [Streptomyces coeruleoprunus]|uniref:Peptidoglycan-binding protein n=1 Tax=Streptomyces coeruleoprunus TaxID=285563 RepID=A0ABV9XAX2_9ACTN
MTGAAASPAGGFEPLRIRPYVALAPHEGAGSPAGGAPHAPRPEQPVAGPLPPEAQAGPVPPQAPPADLSGTGAYGAEGDVESTLSLSLPDVRAAVSAAPPDVTPDHGHPHGPGDGRRPASRRPAAAIAVAAAVVAVIGTAAFAGGLFDDDEPADRLAPEPSVSGAPWPSSVATPSEEASASVSATDLASPSASGSSASQGSESPSASLSEAPEALPTQAGRPDSGTESTRGVPTQEPTTDGTSLSRGDRSQAVRDLQHRLRELGLYSGPLHGQYDNNVERAVAAYQERRGISGDPRGVYGPATRTSLEAETSGR